MFFWSWLVSSSHHQRFWKYNILKLHISIFKHLSIFSSDRTDTKKKVKKSNNNSELYFSSWDVLIIQKKIILLHIETMKIALENVKKNFLVLRFRLNDYLLWLHDDVDMNGSNSSVLFLYSLYWDWKIIKILLNTLKNSKEKEEQK
jgi:hypothetical protein